jgi:hypothetical protein
MFLFNMQISNVRIKKSLSKQNALYGHVVIFQSPKNIMLQQYLPNLEKDCHRTHFQDLEPN